MNVAESTNFASRRWFTSNIGSKAKRCICRPHSVDINVSLLETLYLRSEIENDRDTSDFHSTDGIVTISRRYRCICNVNSIFKIDDNTRPSFCCVKCSLWGHIDCYDVDDQGSCYMCAGIDAETDMEQDGENTMIDNNSASLVSPKNKQSNKKKRNSPQVGSIQVRRNIVRLFLWVFSIISHGFISSI